MTEEIINSDGTRNWEANILLDNIKRLEQENKQMKSALEEIREINKLCFERKYGYPEDLIEIDDIIREVLQ
jgi:hypothetical protein